MVHQLDPTEVDRYQETIRTDLEFKTLLRDKELEHKHLDHELLRIKGILDQGGFAFASSRGLILVRPLTWDSAHFGFPCADLTRFYAQENISINEQQALINQIIDCCKQKKIRLLSVRLPVAQVAILQRFLAQGFLLVDTSIELGLKNDVHHSFSLATGHLARDAVLGDLERVELIASSFVNNRFHRDDKIPRDKATQVYLKWVKNAIKNQHGRLLVVESHKSVLGFSTYRSGSPPLDIDVVGLVVVHPEARGQRVLESLVAGCRQRFRGRAVVTSTQASNAAALRAFGRLGLLPFAARHILHGWFD